MSAFARTLLFAFEILTTHLLAVLARLEVIYYGCAMNTQEIAKAILELPEKERLELARRIVTSIVEDQQAAGAIGQAVQRIEDVIAGKVRGLSEPQFRDALR